VTCPCQLKSFLVVVLSFCVVDLASCKFILIIQKLVLLFALDEFTIGLNDQEIKIEIGYLNVLALRLKQLVLLPYFFSLIA
jgi:hypothetical protein